MATTIGEAVVKLTFDGKDVKSSLNRVSSDIESSGKSSGSMWANAWSVAAGSLISKAVTKIGSVITQNLGRAIERIDTLKNAPKVFQALGYSVDDVNDTMNRLDKYLDGLPTSATEAVQGVQSLAASFGGIKEGTDYFIAMNDAGLAFGATTYQIANAINQLGQLSLDGPLDAQTWNSLRNSGFSPVFAAMAEEAGITVGELKAQFGGSGTKTVQDFLDSLIRLDKEGSGSMESLSELARKNTEGIGTALENVQNRIGKALAKVMDWIGQERISGAINEISSRFSSVADVVVNVLEFLGQHVWVLDTILAFFGSLLALGIASKVASFIQMISTFVVSNPILVAIMAIITVITLVLTHLDEISAWINENLPWLPPVIEKIGEVLGKIGEFIGKVIAKCVELWEYIKPVFERLFELWKFLWENIVQPIIGKIFETIGKRVNELFTVVKFVFETVFNIFKTFFTVAVGIIEGVASFFTGLWDGIKTGVEGAINVVRTVFDNVKNWINDHIVNPIKGFFEGLWNGIKDGAKGVKDFISNIFGTIGNIVKTPINGIIGGINGVLGKINSIKIPDWVPVIGGAHTNFGMIPTLAQGGYADNSTQAIIGEAGKEVVLPLEANTDNWSGLLAETLLEKMSEQDDGDYNGQPLVVNLNLDGSVVEQVLLNKIRRAV